MWPLYAAGFTTAFGARCIPEKRTSQTTGAAELDSELVGAGGPLLVAGVAITYGYAARTAVGVALAFVRRATTQAGTRATGSG
ncbi:hypothetical protein AB0K23_38195 [Streptomyces sp. NPDC049602]|uniref:hypothetical protein n=1 Tax=Streptomyces sp. NPDC049602 TaxID=3155504 RepID=UPI0034318207